MGLFSGAPGHNGSVYSPEAFVKLFINACTVVLQCRCELFNDFNPQSTNSLYFTHDIA